MRRKDREISDRSAILEIMERCQVCHVAFGGDIYPYVIPLSFGFREKDGTLMLYFHGAMEGRKLSLLARNARVAFSMERMESPVVIDRKAPCQSTVFFESVCGDGEMTLATGEEKTEGLTAIIEHYQNTGGELHFPESALERTAVMVLHVHHIVGKRHSS